MGNISRHESPNLGGLNFLDWAFTEDVSGMNFLGTSLYCQVALKPGRQWNRVYGTPETIQLESEQQETPSGIKYLYKLKVLVPKDRAAVESELRKMAGRKLMLMVEDKNGTARYFGTMDAPMKLFSRLMKPSAIESFNGYELTFTGEFSSPAAFRIPSGGIPGGGLEE